MIVLLDGDVSMPQISVYLDDNVITQVRESAKNSNISVSKLITNALEKYMSNQWPEDYRNNRERVR
jgi:predicted transcriptional regulator